MDKIVIGERSISEAPEKGSRLLDQMSTKMWFKIFLFPYLKCQNFFFGKLCDRDGLINSKQFCHDIILVLIFRETPADKISPDFNFNAQLNYEHCIFSRFFVPTLIFIPFGARLLFVHKGILFLSSIFFFK